MIDRTKAPTIHNVDKISLLPLESKEFPNGFKLYCLPSFESKIVQLSLFFKAGWIHQNKKLLANAFTSLITNGTLHYSAREIAEMLEYYGVFYSIEPSAVDSKLQFTFLRKNAEKIIPIIQEMIQYANFPQEELNIYTQTSVEQYQTQIKNVGTLAQWNYSKIIYGTHHPLNKFHTPDDYHHITRDDLLQFFTQHIHPKNGFIFISGNIDHTLIELLNDYLGTNTFHQTQNTYGENIPLPQSYENNEYVHLPDALQSAIKIGALIPIYPQHSDYFDFLIAHTLLGGFFGSRLMRVIREEKAYTYGIYSNLMPYDKFSLFTISSEVKAEHTQASVNEVIHQIQILQENPPNEEELTIVKNYLSGDILDSTDGILKQDSIWKSLIIRHLEKDYYNKLLVRIKEIEPEEISNVLKKHINIQQLKKCIVGKVK